MTDAPPKPSDNHHRWLRWGGAIVGLIIFGIAAWVVVDESRHVTWHDVQQATVSTSPLALTLAGAALLISLLAASSFDALAMAATGKPASWRRSGLTSVLAFALANAGAPGLAVASAARYRAYRPDGLSGADVAVISAYIAGIGLAGGFAMVGLGAAGELAQAAVAAHMPKAVGIVLALLGIKVLAAYMMAPRLGPLRGLLPPRRIRLGIIAASTVEWVAAACILFAVLPAETRGPLFHFLPLFGLAGLLGAVSGLPGGVGAFDAVMIAILGPRVGVAQVAAALLLYRMIYVVGPLLAAIIIGLGSSLRGKPLRGVHAAWEGLAPALFGALIFLAGVVMLVSVATPDGPDRLKLLAALAPAGLVNLSHFVASLAAVALLFLAFGVGGRVYRAYLAALIALIAAAVATLAKGLNIEEALFLGGLALLLFAGRAAFYRRGASFRAGPLSPASVTAIAATLASAGALGLFAYQHVDYHDDLWWTFVTDQGAPKFLRAAVGAVVLALVLLVWRFIRPGGGDVGLPDTSLMQKAKAALAGAEDATPDANLAFLGDKQLLFSASGRSFIQYGVRGSSWISMGDPVGPRSERLETIWAFRELCDRHGAQPAFYAVRRGSIPDYVDCGLIATKIGENAVVDLADFGLEGRRRASLRQAYNRGQRDGVTFEVLPPEGFETVEPELRAVSDAWLEMHHGEEKGFSLGRFEPAYLANFPTAVLRQEGAIVAFANLWRTPDGKTLSIDLMRYGAEAPKNAMDILFVQLMLWGKDQGFAEFDLGMAPLSGLDGHRLAKPITRAGAFVYAEGGGLYGFEGLRAFKAKFTPRWEPIYITAPGGWVLGRALTDAALLSSGGLFGLLR